MNTRAICPALVSTLGVALSLSPGSAFAQQIYRLTDVGVIGVNLGSVTAINASGQVAGLTDKRGRGGHAHRWNGTRLQDLGTLGGESSLSVAINASGQVAGSADTGDGKHHAFLWNRGTMQDLGTLGGTFSTSGRGKALNDAGQVTGVAALPVALGQHAFLWDGTTMRDLGTLGGRDSTGTAINALGHVTGQAVTTGGRLHAFLFDGDSMEDLGTLGGFSSSGNAINDSGLVIGSSLTTGDAANHAFLWDGTRMRDLGTLGGQNSVGVAINAFGQAAGFADTGDGEGHAFLWDGSVMHDLGTLGGSFSLGRAINAAGQVTGASFTTGDNVFHAFLWDGATLHDLNDLIDRFDPLKAHVIVNQGDAINDARHIVASGRDSRLRGSRNYVLSPATPDDLRANNGVTATGAFVRLAWSDRFPDESRFQIERSPVTGTGASQQCGAFIVIGSRKKDATVFRDTTVSRDTKYCYQLRVFRSTVVPTMSNIARIRTQ
jgi:probable HAF family extracellular repeat protein